MTVKSIVKRILEQTDLKKVSKHLHGKEHSFRHKSLCGLLVMFLGVFIAKSASFFEYHFMHYLLDMSGYLIHGVGAIPFVEQYITQES